ncbi:quinone oxidoreductase family protein [Brevibacillus sp. SIMBA_040]|uniref:quinone oxidoreductase family protein n=1 Tax=unclassified Brevibacillus TaxID=2684853 RepID=UPI00397BD953
MKAILVTELGGPETMKYAEVEMPIMGPTQVLIRVEMTSVNFADIKARYGNKGAAKLPFIPGLDATGVVEQVGSQVQHLAVGQRVIAFPANGSYAEYIVADEALTFVVPDQLSTEKAAACPVVSFTSYQLLAKVARIEKGETVLIHAAAGGIGTTAIQLAKLLGAGQVIGTVGSKAKAELAYSAGADHVICNDSEDFVEKVRELTDGAGADIILDSISGTVSERSLECLAWYGRLVHFGNASGQIGQIKTIDLHASCRSVLGFSFGTTRKLRPHLLQNTAKTVLAYLAAGSLDIKIGKHFALEDAASAHEWVESRASTGKVLLDARS